MKLTMPERITDAHVFFWGSIYSNWYPSDFKWIGYDFKNSEAALMYYKAIMFKDYEIADRILMGDQEPRDVKELGRLVSGYDDKAWSEKRLGVMIDILHSKFSCNTDFKEILLSHRNMHIVEASPYDKIWGVGLHWSNDDILDENNWDGDNLLGKALMIVANDIK